MKPASILIPTLLLLFSALSMPPAAEAFDGCHAADVDDNGVVNFVDVQIVINNFGLVDPRLDLDGSGWVDLPDALIVVDFFQVVCPSCPGDLNGDEVVDAADRALVEIAIDDDELDCSFDVTRDGSVDADEDVDTCLYYFQNPSLPPALRCDFDDNGTVNILDIVLLLQETGTDCRFDLSKDGVVDTTDIWFLLSSWGACPASS